MVFILERRHPESLRKWKSTSVTITLKYFRRVFPVIKNHGLSKISSSENSSASLKGNVSKKSLLLQRGTRFPKFVLFQDDNLDLAYLTKQTSRCRVKSF